MHRDSPIRRVLGIIGPAMIMAGLSVSCTSNDMAQVLELSDPGNRPVRSTENVVYTYTDSGRVTNTLKAGKVDRYASPDSTYSLISNGFELLFYTDSGDFDGRLVARNGYISDNNSLMIARDSVVFVNKMNETLYTEELMWFQDSAKVFTDKFVTIERDDAVIYGHGLTSDQNFTNYVIRDVTGMLYLDENEE